MSDQKAIVVRCGQVYDHDGDVHKPKVADILIQDGTIVTVGQNLDAGGAEIVDARNRLVVPGLINAHYHSHDTLCRGLFEELPLEFWLLYTLPLGINRSKEELRARTLVGALESIQCGITCVQDMLGLFPLDDESTDVVVDAYREIGLRVVFSPMVWDIPPIAMVRHRDSLPSDVQDMLGTVGRPIQDQLDYLERQFDRHAGTGPLHWAVAPFAPQRCSPKMLQGCAELSHKHDLPVYTHVYETRGQRLIARELFAEHDGSLITYMERNGLLGAKLNIVHSVWITRPEMDRMAAADAGIVLNHLSNLKVKSGNARTAGLQGKVGAIKAGHKADLVLIDLNDTAYLPYNSAARQLVYTETGRGIDSVMIDGRMVMQERRVTSIDTDALRREVESLMRHFIADYDAVVKSRARALPYMREAHRRMWEPDVGMNRFIARTR